VHLPGCLVYTQKGRKGVVMAAAKSDLPQGTLDLLILKVVALGPVHGYAIAQGFSRYRAMWCKCRKDRCIPSEMPEKRFNLVRIAIPARTTRHRQAAVHTLWSPGTLDAKRNRTIFYGFLNSAFPIRREPCFR
jgi:hypothetical protein